MSRCSLLALCLFVLTVGCSKGDRPTIAKASGIVTLDGNPVDGATVTFEPVNGGRPCFGTTDLEGRFAITSYEEGDGAPVGDHYVSVIKITGPGAAAPAAADSAMSLSDIAPPGSDKDKAEDPDKGTVYLVPRKYINAKTSGLKVTVPDGGSTTLDIKLSVR
ncbi:MAG: hypothetical protein U0996_09045 [Planctomycetaceae bacterium]